MKDKEYWNRRVALAPFCEKKYRIEHDFETEYKEVYVDE